MYDKADSVLRVEMAINDPEAFKVRRQVERGGEPVTQWVPMSKGVANLFRHRDVSMSANSHYLEALAVVDDPTPAIRDLDKITERKRIRNGKSVRAFNLLARQGLSTIPPTACLLANCQGPPLETLASDQEGTARTEKRDSPQRAGLP